MENCIQIGSGDLKVCVAEPGKYYNRARFDWSGFIPQISLRGRTFCVKEENDTWNPTGSGGEGLCSEYRVDNETMGWDNRNTFFLKPGIGMLERADDKPYHFATEYRIVKPFPCTMNIGADYANFHLRALPLKGIAYTTDKHVSVIDNMLTITTTITNTGEKPLYFREYNHNFLSMNGLGAHPEVTLSLEKNYKNHEDTPGLIMNETGIGFTNEIKSGFMIFCQEPTPYAPMRWTLLDKKANMSVQEWGDFDVTGFLAWGGPHVIAPEIYGDFPVESGETRSWTRLWKFFAK